MVEVTVILLIGAVLGGLMTREVMKEQMRKERSAQYKRWYLSRKARRALNRGG